MWWIAPAFALPSIDAPARTGATAPADSAVVVGIEDYFVLPDVPYANRDAQAFYDFAVYTRGVPSDRVTLLTGPVSREKLTSALDAAGKRTKAGGTVFVYFAGHGAASPSTGERILVGADAQPDLDTFQARAVTVADVKRLATAGGGSAVLVLDACYSGKSRSGADLVAGKRFAVPTYATAGTPRVVEWTAAGPDQWSGPLESASHGAFTYLAIGALRGWADGQRDGVRDGTVTAEEASLYVEQGLRTLQITDQRPERVGDGAVVLSKGSEAAPDLTGAVSAAPRPSSGTTAAPAPQQSYGTGPGQLQVSFMALANLFVDGKFYPMSPASPGVIFVDDVSPGAHLVELRSGFGKTLVTQDVEVPQGTQLRLRYKDRVLSEIGRGPTVAHAATAPAPTPAPGVAPSGGVLSQLAGSLDHVVAAPASGGGSARNLTPAATGAEMQAHLATLDGIMMADDKVGYLRTIAPASAFSCAQVAQFVDAIAFSAQKVAAVRALRSTVVDPQNFGEILDVLTFAEDKRQVEAIFAAQ